MLPWLRKVYKNYEILVFHGLFNVTLWDFFATEPEIAGRSAWVVFGGEIYEGLANPSVERLRLMRKTTQNLKYILTFTTQEERIIKEQLNRKGKIGRYVYLQNWLKASKKLDKMAENDSRLSLLKSNEKIALIGNSGTTSNEHHKILSALGQNKFEGVLLIPLVYGATDAYRKEVIDYAKSIFPEKKVIALCSALLNDEYLTLLASIDYYFFGHLRQQAGQHWFAALASGTPIYGNPEGASFKHFSSLGFHIGNVFKPDFSETFLALFKRNEITYRKQFNTQSSYTLWKQALSL
nr:TDP-N-acetylfucosamine:lipid II N-acetylfucosaminyltransferase [Alteromonas sp. ASW11-130]